MGENGQTVAHEVSHNILIIKAKVEIEHLTANQGVVGSNPAGRAKFVLLSIACSRKLAGLFLLVQLEVFLGLELHKLRGR